MLIFVISLSLQLNSKGNGDVEATMTLEMHIMTVVTYQHY
jgi:hypothetical protein